MLQDSIAYGPMTGSISFFALRFDGTNAEQKIKTETKIKPSSQPSTVTKTTITGGGGILVTSVLEPLASQNQHSCSY